jgi:hypothetical protein
MNFSNVLDADLVLQRAWKKSLVGDCLSDLELLCLHEHLSQVVHVLHNLGPTYEIACSPLFQRLCGLDSMLKVRLDADAPKT